MSYAHSQHYYSLKHIDLGPHIGNRNKYLRKSSPLEGRLTFGECANPRGKNVYVYISQK